MDDFDSMLKAKAKEEKLKIPDSLERKIEKSMNNLPRRQTMKKRSVIAVVAAAAIITTSLTFVYAKDIPLINTVIEFFKGNSSLKYSGDAQAYVKYSTEVGKTITSNGVSITIDNIACDGNFLVLFYTAEGDGEKVSIGEGGIPIVNGILGEISIDGNQKKISNNDSSDAYLTDDGKVKGMIRADISGDIFQKYSKVDFSVSYALAKEGKWDFKLDVSKETAMKDVKIVEVNKNAYIKNPDGREHNINIQKVSFTPFGNQIIISEKFDTSVSKYTKENSPSPFSLFALFDDKGNELDVLRGQLISEPENARNSFEFIKGGKGSKYLTLVPIYTYADNAPKEINYNPVISIDKFPLELKMSSKGALIIEKIEYGEDDTKLYYTKKGTVLNEGNFFFVDEEGNDVFDNMSIYRKDYIINRDKGIYVSVLPKLDTEKKYKLGYITDEKFDLLDQYKIEIPLN
ncbi:DUF4179 domain-containing protein [Acetivibrio cellulolyticus]|uniref:DUF4179 domain-containing protein n=1 Tax=Acetivibrio cellulolyticus TaxID=35830 RepID=UPI0002481CB2|nr:DUF4179 domain-containing protein [Acetivibrio cellulolyticus]